MRPMQRAIPLVCLVLAGCFSSPVREDIFYGIAAPGAPVEKGEGPVLAVAEFDASPGYDQSRIAYRTGEGELRFYGYRRWLGASPAAMVEDALIRHLRASGRFALVGREALLPRPSGVLHGRVVAIEEVDGDERWQARLAMSLTLRDPLTEAVLLRHAFDVTRPCARRHPKEVARVIAKILADEAARLSDRVADRLGEAAAPPAPTGARK